MKIEELSITALLVTGLVLPYLLFLVHNAFKYWWLTAIRALLAVGAGWIFWLSFVFAADALNLAAATSEDDIHTLNDGDGAKYVFALLLGWVVPALTVALSWLFHRMALPRLTALLSKQ